MSTFQPRPVPSFPSEFQFCPPQHGYGFQPEPDGVKRTEHALRVQTWSDNEKVVIAEIQTEIGTFTGTSRCDPHDQFDLYFGRALAVDRAICKYTEALFAPFIGKGV